MSAAGTADLRVCSAQAWLAQRLDRHAEAVSAFARALHALGPAPADEPDEQLVTRAELVAGEAASLWELGRWQGVLPRLQAAMTAVEASLKRTSSPRADHALVWLRFEAGRLWVRERQLALALPALRQALEGVTRHAAPLLHARTQSVLATALALSGEPGAALPHIEAALARWRAPELAGWVRDRVRLTANLGVALADMGRLQAASEALQEAAVLVQGLTSAAPIEARAEGARLRRNLGTVLSRMNALDAAIVEFRASVEAFELLLRRRAGAGLNDVALWRSSLAGSQLNLGYSLFLRGDMQEADHWQRRAAHSLARLVKAQPATREELVRVRVNQAHLAARFGQPAHDVRARALYRRGVRDFAALVAEGRTHCESDRVNASLGLARMQLRLGHAADAAQLFESALRSLAELTRRGQLQHAQAWLAAWQAQAAECLALADRHDDGLVVMVDALERAAAHPPLRPAIAGPEPVLILLAAVDRLAGWSQAAAAAGVASRPFERLAAAHLRVLFAGASALLADADPQWLSRFEPEVDRLCARLRDAAAARPAAARLLADWFFATHGLRAQRIALTLGSDPAIATLRALLLELHALELEMLGERIAREDGPADDLAGRARIASAANPAWAGGPPSPYAVQRAQRWAALRDQVDALRLQLVQRGLLPEQQALRVDQAAAALGARQALALLARVDSANLLLIVVHRPDASGRCAEHHRLPLGERLRHFSCSDLNRMARGALCASARQLPMRGPADRGGDLPQADDGADFFAQEMFHDLWAQTLAPVLTQLAARDLDEIGLVPANDLHLAPWSHLATQGETPVQRLSVYPNSGAWLRGRVGTRPSVHGTPAVPRWVLAAGAAMRGPRPLPWVEVEQRLSRQLWGDALTMIDLPSGERPRAEGVDALLGMGHGGAPDGNPAHAALALDGAMLSAHDLPRLRVCRHALLSACVLGLTQDAHGEPLGFLSTCFDYRVTFAVGWLTEVPDRVACLFSLAAQWALREAHGAASPDAPAAWADVLRDLRRELVAGRWPAGFPAWWVGQVPELPLALPPPDLRRALPWLLVLGE